MYDNIGGKIKTLGKAAFIFEAIGAVIAAITLMGNSEVSIGFLVLFGGPIVAWVSSWLLYGFGQLIENCDTIAEQFHRDNEKYHAAVAEENEKKAKLKQKQQLNKARATLANADADEDAFVDILCPNCKAELSYTKGQLQRGEELTCPLCEASISL